MSTEKEAPLLGKVAQEEPVDAKTKCKRCCWTCCKKYGPKICFYGGGVLLVIFVLMWILQFILSGFYYWGCSSKYYSPGKYGDYEYIDGRCNADKESCRRGNFPASATSKAGGPEFNVLHKSMVLKQSEQVLWGMSFDVYDVTEGANDIYGGVQGKWWRKWGPWFTTYYYEESSGESYPKLIYMRKKLLSFSGDSHIIGRCDGQYPVYIYSEGDHWFSNLFTGWRSSDKGWQFDIHQDDKFVATAIESKNAQNINFFNDTKARNQYKVASTSQHEEGDKHKVVKGEWNVENFFYETNLPYYLPNAIALLLAFAEFNKAQALEKAKERQAQRKKHKKKMVEAVQGLWGKAQALMGFGWGKEEPQVATMAAVNSTRTASSADVLKAELPTEKAEDAVKETSAHAEEKSKEVSAVVKDIPAEMSMEKSTPALASEATPRSETEHI